MQAEECFKECVSVDQRHLQGLLLYGVVCTMQDKHDAAETFFEAATAIDPKNIMAWTMLGLSHFLLPLYATVIHMFMGWYKMIDFILGQLSYSHAKTEFKACMCLQCNKRLSDFDHSNVFLNSLIGWQLLRGNSEDIAWR